jgi:hypothetical protein
MSCLRALWLSHSAISTSPSIAASDFSKVGFGFLWTCSPSAGFFSSPDGSPTVLVSTVSVPPVFGSSLSSPAFVSSVAVPSLLVSPVPVSSVSVRPVFSSACPRFYPTQRSNSGVKLEEQRQTSAVWTQPAMLFLDACFLGCMQLAAMLYLTVMVEQGGILYRPEESSEASDMLERLTWNNE